VAPRKLRHVVTDCRKAIQESLTFAAEAHTWSLPGSAPHISRKKRDWITELAFLRAFLAMESFLEESFILYSLGQLPPRGKPPRRHTFPPSRSAADDWVIPEGRRYASWAAHDIRNRAKRFFRGGRPFETALSASQTALEEARTIRNAIAHESSSTHQKFEGLVRQKLGTLPPGLTPGGFLGSTVPSSHPPESFLEFYVTRMQLVVAQIVPGS
jgi:hypothetical protein